MGKSEDLIDAIYMNVFDTLVEGALSMKLTEITSNLVAPRLNGEGDKQEQYDNMAVLFTLPNGVCVADPKAIARDWLVPELAKKLNTMRKLEPYGVIKYFIAEIDKITVEVL